MLFVSDNEYVSTTVVQEDYRVLLSGITDEDVEKSEEIEL